MELNILEPTHSLEHIEQNACAFLQELLSSHAAGLAISREKTQTAVLFGIDRPIVRQSRSMERIQHAVSGGFDAVGGEEILAAIQGLTRSQDVHSPDRPKEGRWEMAPIADVRDATVARFSATKYRTTFRSLRPLMIDEVTFNEKSLPVFE